MSELQIFLKGVIKMKKTVFILAASLLSLAAQAEVKVGVVISTSGPAASLGIPSKNVIDMLPDKLGGQPARYIVLDDATDATAAVKHARKLIEQDKVDVIIGSSTVPGSLGVAGVAGELKTPQLAMAPVPLNPAQNPWLFALPQPAYIMMQAVVEHMKTQKIKTVGYIGFADSWGDLVLAGLERGGLEAAGIKIVASERYMRNDTSVAGQVLKVVGAKPDAVALGGTGTPAVLPQAGLRERGYQGIIYQNSGVINPDFLRVGGKAVEGAFAPTGPVMVAEQLPDSNVIKPVALAFVQMYEGKYGKGSRNAFGAYIWDNYLVLNKAVEAALKTTAQPGTQAFRDALRQALENTNEVVGTHAVYTMSPTEHAGVDQRGGVMVQVKNGDWALVK
jgi:branched-chain amino acid transport system substrate-binding protein